MSLSIAFGGFRGGMFGSQERGLVRSNDAQFVSLVDGSQSGTYRDPQRTQTILNMSKAVPLGQA